MRTLIADPVQLEATLALLQPGAIADGGWTREYADPATGTVWRRVQLFGEAQGGGYPCLIRMPAPTRAELLALVQASGALDEIWAAAVLLYADPESYPELLELLEQLAQGSEWARMRSAIEGSGIASGINRRVHLGQTVAEIDRDAAHFAMLAERSRSLMAEACAALGPEVRTPGDRVSAPWAAA